MTQKLMSGLVILSIMFSTNALAQNQSHHNKRKVVVISFENEGTKSNKGDLTPEELMEKQALARMAQREQALNQVKIPEL